MRHKKFLKYPLHLTKTLLCSEHPKPGDADLLCLVFQFLARYNLSSSTARARKRVVDSNKEYFVIKGGIKLVAHIYKVPHYQNSPAGFYAATVLGTAAISGR